MTLQKKHPTIKLKKPQLRKILTKILNDSDWKNIPNQINSVSIVLTTDNEVHYLNVSYRNKDKPTDVLSFSQLESQVPGNIDPGFLHNNQLGDVVISLDTAKIQAKKYQHSLDFEVLRLSIHGILHLMGYDHVNVSKQEATRMRRLERKLFAEYVGLMK